MLFTATIRYGIGDVLGSCRVAPEECFRCRKEEEVEEVLFEVRISGTAQWCRWNVRSGDTAAHATVALKPCPLAPGYCEQM
jgi:hypothetical protein